MQNLKTYIGEHGPLSWRTCLSSLTNLLQGEQGQKLVLPLSLSSFQIDPGTNQLDLILDSAPNQTDFAYQSPELCLGVDKSGDERSLVYSLGCVVYACLSGSPPFLETNDERLKELQVSEYPQPISMRVLDENLPCELDEILAKAMAKDPQNRFENRDQFAQGLESLTQTQASELPVYKPQSKSVGKYLAMLAIAPIFSFSLSHNPMTQKLIADSHPQSRQIYHLGIESAEYRLQLEFDDEKLEPVKGKKQIQILNILTKKIMFATTKRQTFKDALEEAVRRGLDLKGADLSNQDLNGANLTSGKFSKAVFIDSKLNNVNLYSAHLDGCDFRGAELKNCMLGDVHSVQTNFSNVDLSSSQMMNGFFLQANFSRANLSNCDLTGAKLNQANMEFADLTDAKLNNASRSSQMWDNAKVTQEQLKTMDLIGNK